MTEASTKQVAASREAEELATRPKIVGASVKRTEDPRLLTGKGAYVDDRKAAGVLHVAFRRSDHSHALIKSIDCSAAGEADGVVAVFTAEDMSEVNAVFATSRMKNYYATPITGLATDKVRYVGEPVVGVIARSRYLAEDALELLDIAYEPLAVVIDPEEAAKPSSALLHEEAGTNVLCSREFKTGDAEAAIANAAVRVSGRFRFHRKTPTAMENRTYLAEYEPGRDELTLYTSSQVPGIIRDALSDALDMPGSQLRVIAPDVGGGFGGKASLYPEEIFVAFAARRLGCAVKWTSDRMEDLAATSQGFDQIVDAELALDRRCRCLFDLSVDGRDRAGSGSEFSAWSLQDRQLSWTRPWHCDVQAADRTVSGCRAADVDIRDRALDGHGRATARHGSGRVAFTEYDSAG